MPIAREKARLAEYSQPAAAAVAKVLTLLGLIVWAFWPEFTRFARTAISNSDWAHGLVVPIAVVMLVLRRRGQLLAGLRRGSFLGMVGLLLGLGVYAVFTWPLAYGYPRDVAILLVCAGAILAACGGRVLKLCLPMLLLLFLSIPLGARIYAARIIRLETFTLSTTRFALDSLPGVEARLDGPDLLFTVGDRSGTVALGEPRRGATLLATYVAIGVFVVFSRMRPYWQIALMAAAAVPITLLCNLLRLVGWGVLTVCAGPDPPSFWPRATATTTALLLAYVIFLVGCWFLSWVSRESVEVEGALEPGEAADA